MKIRKVYYLRESPFFTDRIADIRLIEHSKEMHYLIYLMTMKEIVNQYVEDIV